MTKVKQAELFADSARGIYIPQHFAESANIGMRRFWNIEPEQWSILESGPKHSEEYWSTWDEVLSDAETDCGGVLGKSVDRIRDSIAALSLFVALYAMLLVLP